VTALCAVRRLSTAPVAALSLVVGFAVAQATGVRPLGGIVLAVALGWCGLRWRVLAGATRAAVLVALYLAAFVGSHLLADVLGTWGAVIVVAMTVGLAAWLAADRPALHGSAARA
jgi:hypothetical protein